MFDGEEALVGVFVFDNFYVFVGHGLFPLARGSYIVYSPSSILGINFLQLSPWPGPKGSHLPKVYLKNPANKGFQKGLFFEARDLN